MTVRFLVDCHHKTNTWHSTFSSFFDQHHTLNNYKFYTFAAIINIELT